MIDLSSLAGFPLQFDKDTFHIATGDIQFIREPRLLEEMRPVLQDARHPARENVLYWNYKLAHAGESNNQFVTRQLTFGLVLLPPGRIGKEYMKTHGHYHSAMPGSQIGYPEVYTHFYGTLYLFMQRRRGPADNYLDDCVLYTMVPGQSITIPPGYSHILINPSTEPGLMAGLYSISSVHNYEPIKRMAGTAYYAIDEKGQARFERNPAYINPPPLRVLTSLAGTPFEPPDPPTPLWQSFISNPERYEFIYDARQAKLRFVPEDLRL